MSTYDLVFIVIIVLSLALGLLRGFITEIFAIGKWLIAIWVTLRFGDVLSAPLEGVLPAGFGGFSGILSQILVFIASIVILMVLESLVQGAAGNAGLSPYNRFIGGMLGIVRGIFICVIVVWLGALAKQDETDAWKSSKMMPFFTGIYDRILVATKDRMTGFGNADNKDEIAPKKPKKDKEKDRKNKDDEPKKGLFGG